MINSVRQFLAPPVFPDDEDKTRAAQVLNTLLLGTMGVLVLAGIATPLIFVEKLYNLILGSMFFLVMAVTHWVTQCGRVRLASAMFVSGIWIVFTVFLCFAGGMTSIVTVFYVAGTVTAGLLLGERAALIYAAACSLAGLGMVIAEANGFLPSRVFPVPARVGWLDMVLCLLVTLTALNLTLRGLRDALARARYNEQALAESHRKLEAEIAERVRAEEALRRREQELFSFMNSAADTFYLLDSDLNFLEINQKGLELIGRKREDVVGKPITDIS